MERGESARAEDPGLLAGVGGGKVAPADDLGLLARLSEGKVAPADDLGLLARLSEGKVAPVRQGNRKSAPGAAGFSRSRDF